MDFLINFLGLAASVAVLIWGADKFVDNSSILANKLGINGEGIICKISESGVQLIDE